MSKASEIWVGPTAYAKHRGVDLSTVKTWIKEGKLEGCIKKGNNNRNKINQTLADQAMDGGVDNSVEESEKPTANANMSLTKARTAKTAIEVQTARLKLQQISGELVKKSEVVQVAREMGNMTKEALLNLPDRLSPILASETSIEEINHILTDSINEALRNLSTGNFEFFRGEQDDSE